MSHRSATVLPFVLTGRWIVTVESERVFVKVRHRTRWYAVARRKGQEDHRHWCASRADALGIAEYMREAFERLAFREYVQAMLARLLPLQRAMAIEKLRALADANQPPIGHCHLTLVEN